MQSSLTSEYAWSILESYIACEMASLAPCNLLEDNNFNIFQERNYSTFYLLLAALKADHNNYCVSYTPHQTL